MSDIFRQRLEARLEELGLSASKVSRSATGSPDTIRSWLNHPERSPRVDTLAKVAAELDTTPEWLLGRSDIAEGPRRPASDVRPAQISPPSRDSMPADVPVMGTAAGSLLSGSFQFQGGVIDYVRRPPALSGARDIYALFVEGSSMEPRYFPGDLVYVNPHKPPRITDVVIVQEGNGDPTAVTASIGVLHKRANGAVILLKYNPAGAEITIEMSRVIAIHKVLTPNELFGI
ncbi:LexA family transcriptional regulator [Hoeflea sp.]|uniref:XRE family transcriptional regulator n=1 Tax=Hoeflea sp. TaxID=1940281 RepID=UPI0019966835|nr:LexA family transcriptional regulator [Hoeflea sp.]MBC7280012.1 LexA family transcriptional regulator [Hoeflea sp.]